MHNIGFIGLGNMGAPMARNLLGAGFEVLVWTRTRSKAEPLVAAGAKEAASPGELAREADAVLSCLATVAASRELFLAADGILSRARAGQVFIDHATVDVRTSREAHALARAHDARFLDAPVSGGPEGARAGTLSIMVGGERDDFEKALPLLRAMGRTVSYMGPSGAGTAAKLANQLLVGVHTLASCEALLLARESGVDLEELLSVLERSWGWSRMLERNGPAVIQGEIGPSGAPARNLEKDLSIVLELAREHGLELPAAKAAADVFRRLVAGGRGEWDIAAASSSLEEGRE